MSEDAYMGGIQDESGQGMTPSQVVAGFESVRTFCLNAIVGDPLAFAFGMDPGSFATVEGTPTTPVEFIAQTMTALMTEAIALVQRLESHADGAEEWCRAERQTVEALGDRNATLEREITTLRRALGVSLVEPLPTWVQRYAESAPEPPAEPPARQVGDMFTDRIGTRWRVNRIGSVGTVLVNRTTSVHSWELSTVEREYGPLVWDTPEPVSARESDGETSPGTPTPEGVGYAAYAASMDAEDDAFGQAVRARRRGAFVDTDESGEPCVRAVGDVCTDSMGYPWQIREIREDGTVVLHNDGDHILQYELTYVERHWGPLAWRRVETDAPEGPEDDAEGSVARAVPSMGSVEGDTCTDACGRLWVAHTHDIYGNLRMYADHGVGIAPDRLESAYGPLEWHARDTDRSAGTDVPETPEEDDTAPWVPSVGDVCEDRDGSRWKVRFIDRHGMALLDLSDNGLAQSMRFVADRWGPLRWDNGHVTHGS